MEVRSTYKHARISPYKARQVTREIQGLRVSDALDILNFTPKKAALLVGKTLRSAVANAENNHDMVGDSLLVKEAVIGQGPALKRFKARAKGSASPIKKRTSHIYILLTDEVEEEEPKAKSPKKKAAKKVAKKVAAPAKAEEDKGAEKKDAGAAGATGAEGSRVDEKLGLVYDKAPEQVDDLKQISGVGEVLEGKLHDNGVYTFAQVAAWNKDQIAEFSELLSFPDRIERDEWIKQAKELGKA